MSDILCYDKSIDQYFRTTEESVKTAEKRVNDILLEKEPVSFDEFRRLTGIEELNQNEDDMDEPKERRQFSVLIDTTAEDYTREQKRDIMDIFRSMLSRLDYLKSEVTKKGEKATGETEAGVILKTLYMGEQNGLNTAWLEVYDVMKELKKELYPERA